MTVGLNAGMNGLAADQKQPIVSGALDQLMKVVGELEGELGELGARIECVSRQEPDKTPGTRASRPKCGVPVGDAILEIADRVDGCGEHVRMLRDRLEV